MTRLLEAKRRRLLRAAGERAAKAAAAAGELEETARVRLAIERTAAREVLEEVNMTGFGF